METKSQKLSSILDKILGPSQTADAASDDPSEQEVVTITSLGALVDELEHHGMAVILILFSLPSALPVPAPGYSTVLAIPLLMIGLRILAGYETIWLPEKLRKRHFNPADFQKAGRMIRKVVGFIERFSKPRMVWLVNFKGLNILLGILIIALGCSMALPIPGTNTLPAGGIFLIGFSLLEDDGLLLLIGLLYSLAALCFSILVIYLGYEAVKLLILNFF